MSTKKNTKGEKGISPTFLKFPQLRENITKIYKQCGENKSEAARRIGVKPQVFDKWLSGEAAPSATARKVISSVLGVDVYTLTHGSVGERADEYLKKPLNKQRQKLIQLALEIAEHGEDRFVNHLVDQIGFLNEAMHKRKAPKSGGGGASGGGLTTATADTPEPYITRELQGEDEQ